jgi:hypothetical protein
MLSSAALTSNTATNQSAQAFELRSSRAPNNKIAICAEDQMLRIERIAIAVSLAAIAGCQDAVSPTATNLGTSAARESAGPATVRIQDACDPTTFAVVPGGCQRDGGMTLDQFTAILTKLQRVPAWQFAPADLFINEGDAFHATNFGGENHTFTEVDEFGGGIVPALNELAGLTTVAPECQTLAQTDFIAPGQSSPVDEPDEVGDEHYQCCIHPWMRMTVHIR